MGGDIDVQERHEEQGIENGEKKAEMRERKEEGETVTLGLIHLWAYHLACRGKITVPVPQGPE